MKIKAKARSHALILNAYQ